MTKNQQRYLYQFPNSSNYYLRFRLKSAPFTTGDKYKPSFFCASLKTSDLGEAMLIVRFIKPRLDACTSKYAPFECFQREKLKLYYHQLLICAQLMLNEKAQLSDVVPETEATVDIASDQITKPQLAAPNKTSTLSIARKNSQSVVEANNLTSIEHTSYEKSEHRLKELYQQFRLEKQSSIKPKSIQHYDIAFRLLEQQFGNFDVRTLNKKLAVQIKSSLQQRAGLSSTGLNLSATRLNAYLSNYRTFMNWYLSHNDCEANNPFNGLNVTENHQSQRFIRRIFSENELKRINCYVIQRSNEAATFRNAAYWVPKIALYSGMRLNEVAGLTLSECKYSDGIDYFELNLKRVKNRSSARRVPFHSHLIDLGLISFINNMRQKGYKQLFPELRVGKNGLGTSISKWFNVSLLSHIGIDKRAELESGTRIDFHCLRTTFIDYLNQTGCQLHHLKALVGHELDTDITLNHYTRRPISLVLLQQLVNKFPIYAL